MAENSSSERLAEVDALRGLAALAVVLFHLTWRIGELYPQAQGASITVPWGYYGVNLFFIISGFVIFMTLRRTRQPADFVVSRFSRLYPAYWVAVLATFTVTHLLGLPGKEVSALAAAGNVLMFHGLFRIPYVDGVYWTLEIELLFYVLMFLLYRSGRLERVHTLLLGLLALRWAYYIAAQAFHVDLPWRIYYLLILKHLPWFALGVCIYQASAERSRGLRAPALTGAAALITLWVTDEAKVALLAAAMALAVWLAASGRLKVLRAAPLVWLGTISYPLYLLHENIGWAVQLRLLAVGWSMDATVVAALLLSLAMAAVLNRTVEQPAMRWIRQWWKHKKQAAAS